MKITRAVVPSLFTVLNMFCGFHVDHPLRAGANSSPASWFIILAAGFDSLDGIMARITKILLRVRRSDRFALRCRLVRCRARHSWSTRCRSRRSDGLGIFLSSLLMIFGGLRLARFNVQLVGFDKDHFVGLPIPASAITVASFTLNYFTPESRTCIPARRSLLPWMVAGLALLMVSKVKYDTLPKDLPTRDPEGTVEVRLCGACRGRRGRSREGARSSRSCCCSSPSA